MKYNYLTVVHSIPNIPSQHVRGGMGGEEDKSFSVVIKKSSVSGVDFSLSRMVGSAVATVGTYLHREP